MKEEIIIPITYTRYRTPNGKPTCASDFSKGEVCEFYTTRRFGIHEGCLLGPESGRELKRGGEDGLGHLIPGDW